MKILALESFDSGSHRQVRESIILYSRHEWTWLTRPGREWKWRMRTAAIEMIEEAMGRGLLDEHWDLIFATSLISAADLRAMLPPHLRTVPLALYMHENQAAYPVADAELDHAANGGGRDVHFALTNLTSILAADRVIWNSRWNFDSFLTGMAAILRHASDSTINLVSLRAEIDQKSAVIWPPVEPPPRRGSGKSKRCTPGSSEPVRVVWPHRWEHDKGPDELLSVARELTKPLNLRWSILGERYRNVPESLTTFAEEFGPQGDDVIDHFGYAAGRDEYWQVLRACDWVLSTARHEFFGIAVVEAMLAGCLPWLPARLSYPELLPPDARGLSPQNRPGDRALVIQSVHDHLTSAVAPHAVAQLDDEIVAMVNIVS